MNVLLFQLDGKLPNLALMRISAHHKARGDRVDFRLAFKPRAVEPDLWDEQPDLVYASLIFEKSRPIAERLLEFHHRAIIGGSGWDLHKTLDGIGIFGREKDYSLYPDYRHSIGYSQRGCRLKCSFCVVPEMEGNVRPDETIKEIWRGEPHPRNLCLLDNDFFGNKDWPWILAEFRVGNFRVCFNQGINVRTLTDDQARELATVRYSDSKFERPRLYTAWDNRKDEDTLFRGLERLRTAGVRPDNIMVYVLIGYDHAAKAASPWLTDDDFYRHRRLRDFGCRPYPMPYVRTQELMGFQRWIVRRDDLKVPWERWVRAKYQPANL